MIELNRIYNEDYSTGYADGKRAGLLGVSRCMHMMIDTQCCTSHKYFRGFEAGFRDGLAAIGLEPEVSRHGEILTRKEQSNENQ